MFEEILLAEQRPIPNSPLPVLLYPGCVRGEDKEDRFIKLFHKNGWGSAWVNGVYNFHHFHAKAHEVLGVAQGEVTVLLGGPAGRVVTLKAGDAVLLPAGTGHYRLSSSSDYSIVGAYERGQSPDLKLGEENEYEAALLDIARVKKPESDPVLGPMGPAVTVWGAL